MGGGSLQVVITIYPPISDELCVAGHETRNITVSTALTESSPLRSGVAHKYGGSFTCTHTHTHTHIQKHVNNW